MNGKVNSSFTFIIKPVFYSFVVPDKNQTESPRDTILYIINYYVLLGFVSILAYWIAWATWLMAAERQVRRIRFDIFYTKTIKNFRMRISFSVLLCFEILYDKKLVGLIYTMLEN